MRFIATAALAVATLASPLAFAQAYAPGWYLGLAVGQGKVDGYPLPVESSASTAGGTVTSHSFSPLDGSDMLMSARVGVRVHRNLALEAAYYHLGEYDFDTATLTSGIVSGSARARSYGASVVGILPIDQLDLYGRVGYARTELKGRGADAFAPPHERFNEAIYGVGARWNFAPSYGLFAEYQRHDKLELDGYFIGVDLRF